MKIIIILLLLVSSLTTMAQDSSNTYDKNLADSLGADDYGMKMYFLVILKSGTNQITDATIRDSLFHGHMQNINHMAETGKLVVAGPLRKNEKNYEGIFVLNVKTEEEAKTLLANDPAINSNVLDVELYGWYGSAALPMYLPYHKKVQEKDF